MNRIPDALYGPGRETWLIVGASRGIGLEFVRQLLQSDARIFATVRDIPSSSSASPTAASTTAPILPPHPATNHNNASSLWTLIGSDHGKCQMLTCDVLSESSICACISALTTSLSASGVSRIDHVVLNAGVLRYPCRSSEMGFAEFAFHLHTNAIGPVVFASQLLRSGVSVGKLVFMSSDSGSAQRFREMEDGFAAYAASKAALNMAVRHLAAELSRKDGDEATVVLALHPGEVATDMGNIETSWTVDGIISPEESVRGMLRVIRSKGIENSGTFWTWEGEEYPW